MISSTVRSHPQTYGLLQRESEMQTVAKISTDSQTQAGFELLGAVLKILELVEKSANYLPIEAQTSRQLVSACEDAIQQLGWEEVIKF